MGNEALAEIKSKGREANCKSQESRKSVARSTQPFWFGGEVEVEWGEAVFSV